MRLRVFALLGDFQTECYRRDGDRIQKGDVLASITGNTRLLLKGERTALNLLQHLSGIATETARCVSLRRREHAASISDTRKTLPGLRALRKIRRDLRRRGKNHRFNLSDAAMLKDNHIDAAGGIRPAVEKLRQRLGHTVKIEVEARDPSEVGQAVEAGADIIMLDNMDCDTMRKAVELVAGRALTEASGGITSDTLGPVAQTGVDIISIGALTHSVKALDISLKIVK